MACNYMHCLKTCRSFIKSIDKMIDEHKNTSNKKVTCRLDQSVMSVRILVMRYYFIFALWPFNSITPMHTSFGTVFPSVAE